MDKALVSCNGTFRDGKHIFIKKNSIVNEAIRTISSLFFSLRKYLGEK